MVSSKSTSKTPSKLKVYIFFIFKTGNGFVTESPLYNAFFCYFAFCKTKHIKEDRTNKSDSYVIFTVFA